MLTSYIHAAMHHATYELLPEKNEYFGRIPAFDGVWASAPTLEACRDELEEVLQDWIVLGLSEGHPLPIVDGIDLTIRESA